ncbi:MAG: peptidoglycan-binding protein [Patescibacteria group bacterium]
MKKILTLLLIVVYSLGLGTLTFAADEDGEGAQFLTMSTSGITSNSATLIYTTTAPTVSSSVYGLTGSYGTTGPSTVMGTSHSATFTNLSPSTKYYYRVALTSGEISTGSFTTIASAVEEDKDNNPQFLSVNTSGITSSSVTLLFTTTASTVSSSVYGLTTSYGSTGPTTAMGTSHSSVFTNLSPGTIYYYKITLTGGEISTGSFTTAVVAGDSNAPYITSVVANPNTTSAVVSLTANEPATMKISSGLTNAYGTVSATNPLSSTGTFTLNGLAVDTVYYYKITMTDAAGNVSESASSFKTLGAPVVGSVTIPSVYSLNPTSLTTTGVTLNATLVSANNGAIINRGFEWGLTTAYGGIITVDGSIAAGTTFSQTISGLSPNTTYRYRAFATNSAGKGASVSGTFTTPLAPVTSTPSTSVTNVTTTSSGSGYTSSTNSGSSATKNTGTVQFTRDLSMGMKNDTVKALQVYLNNNGFKIAASGAGSPGLETTYFGPATRIALMNFQRANGISPASGFFGPLTRSKISGGVSTNTSSVTTAPLVLGNNNLGVKALRTILRTKGYFAAYGSAGVPASAAAETTYFGIETQNALKKFQCDKNVVCTGTPDTTGWGKVGPKTRAALGW